MVVRKIRSARDLINIDYYAKFGPETRRAIKDAVNYLKDVTERYEGIVQPSMFKGTISAKLEEVRPLIKADLERHARNAEKTAKFEKREERKLLKIGHAVLLASIAITPVVFILPLEYESLIAGISGFGILLSIIIYNEALFCAGRAMANRDKAQTLREFDIKAE